MSTPAALDETTALAALAAAFGPRWTFTVDAKVRDTKVWRAVPPPDFAFSWGAYPAVTAADPIALARSCGEVQAYEDIATAAEDERLWRAERDAAAREARERSWAAVMAPGSFMNPTGTRPPTCSPDPSGLGRIWHLS